MCINIYELDPAKFLSAPGLAWQAALKKTKVKLDLLTDIDMLLMVEKGIRGGICHSIFRYAKANNKYMKENNLHLHIFNIGMLIIYIVGKCCKSFQWIKEWISEILSGSKSFSL